MKNNKRLICVLSLVLIAVLLAGCAAAGGQGDSTSLQTQPTPVVQELKTTMYCTEIRVEDSSIEAQFEAEVELTVVENGEDGDTFDLEMTMDRETSLDFDYPDNHFIIQHEELGLPYYCVSAAIYHPVTDGYMSCDFAVDLEKEYMIFKISADETLSYIVASSAPDVNPQKIAEHFDLFFDISDYRTMDGENIKDIYFDLYGTWLTEDCQKLEDMPFYLTGTLPTEYESGDTVEMELNFIWPVSSGFRNEGMMTYAGTVDVQEKHHGNPNFHGNGTLYDTNTNESVIFYYNIFPYDASVVIYMNGQYLMCNLRYTSQTDSQLNYYKEFIYTTDP